MPKPHYVIHIGPMKTASTYVQRCLVGAAAELAAQGVYVPRELAEPNAPSVHAPVLTAARTGEIPPDMRAIFAALNRSDHKIVLLTTEHFSGLRAPAIVRLRDMIDADRVTIAYMCRRWSDRLTSACYQKIFAGGVQALPEFVARLMGGEGDMTELDYSLVWERWANVFGRDAIKIVPLSNITDIGADIFARFCTDVLNIEQVPVPPQKGRKAWATPGPQETELLRALNVLNMQRAGKSGSAMFWGLQGQRAKRDLPALFAKMDASAQTFPLDDTAFYFDALYARLEAYADRLSSDADGPQMFTRQARAATYISPDVWLRAGLLGELQAMYEDIVAAGPRVGR